MTGIVDGYAHILPRPFFDAMRDAHPEQGLESLENAPHLWDVESRLEDMDEFGIDRQVIMLARPPMWRGLDPEGALSLVRTANDEIRRIADEHADRFIPVGVIPFGGSRYASEVERCLDDLEMAGIMMFSNVDGRPLDSDEFEPVFERVNDHEVPIWLHPQLHDWHAWTDEYMEHKMFGWPFDTSVALSRLIFSGVLERHPNLRFVAHHLGGMLPFYGDRVRSFYETRRQYPDVYPNVDLSNLARSVDDYFERIYADISVSASAPAMRCGLEFFGADNLVFGVDYPFGPDAGRKWLEETLVMLDTMDLDADTRERILRSNVEKLVE